MRNVTKGLLSAVVVVTLAGGMPASAQNEGASKVVTEQVKTVAFTMSTVSQQQAIGSAKSYLRTSAFSRTGLINQLSSKYGEGFSKADSVYAVNHITVNWNYQAVRSAKSYLRTSHFSRSGLIQQLQSAYGEGFTHLQAVYGVNRTGL